MPSRGRAALGREGTHAAPSACQREAQIVGPMVPAHRGPRGSGTSLTLPAATRRAAGRALGLVLGEDAGDPSPDMRRPPLVGRGLGVVKLAAEDKY